MPVSTQGATQAVSSQGTLLYVKISGNFEEIPEVYGLTDSGGDTPEIDVTTMGSTAEEVLLDFPVAPNWDFELNHRTDSTVHQYLETLRNSGAANDFKWIYSDNEIVEFSGRVKKFQRQAQTRQAKKISVSIKQIGSATVTP